MRYVVGCLAAVGLLVILAVAGCMGLIGFGLFHAAHKPAYAEKQAIEKDYQEDLAKITTALSSGTHDVTKAGLSTDILAIYDGDDDLLGASKGATKNYAIFNGSGTGTLERSGTSIPAIIYESTIQDKVYKVFIADRHTDK
ncbi:MAG: hypothetical protein H0X38_14000 [Planctomycetes bacterium]|nr:hypothetical protein [Planctomycetota bacterium]